MKTLLELGIAQDDRERLLRGLHEGKFNLLLGAGASYGCEGGDGIELKDGATLSQQISKEFSLKLNPDEAKKLPLAYEEAESVNKMGLRRWLRARFIGCKPKWQNAIFRIHWERIWTFNIDDVLENAFDLDRPRNVYADIETFDWKEKITPLESTPNAQQVIYLHGRASDLGGPLDGLIFSIPEYTQATRSFQQWHASFQTHYIEDPFIVCGATLAEEVDISEAIRTKNFSRAVGFPSFIVSHGLDEGQRDRMRRFNLVPVVCPLDEFFTIVLRELDEYRRTADAVASRLKPGTYERFLAQFRKFDTKDTSTPAIEGTNFYGGTSRHGKTSLAILMLSSALQRKLRAFLTAALLATQFWCMETTCLASQLRFFELRVRHSARGSSRSGSGTRKVSTLKLLLTICRAMRRQYFLSTTLRTTWKLSARRSSTPRAAANQPGFFYPSEAPDCGDFGSMLQTSSATSSVSARSIRVTSSTSFRNAVERRGLASTSESLMQRSSRSSPAFATLSYWNASRTWSSPNLSGNASARSYLPLLEFPQTGS